MTLEKFIFTALTTPGSLTGAIVGTRVHPVMGHKNSAAPKVVYSSTSFGEDTTFCGPTGLAAYGVEFEAHAKSFDDVAALARAIPADLRATPGAQLIEVDSVSDLMDPEPGLYARSIAITIWFVES